VIAMCTFSPHTGADIEFVRFVAATAGLYPAAAVERDIAVHVGLGAELRRATADINLASRFPSPSGDADRSSAPVCSPLPKPPHTGAAAAGHEGNGG
jgi:hypothetical protein